MTFKFGITNDAYKRWNNRKYGYKHCVDKFEKMLIVYSATNPHGPAFLEAALIDRYESTLAEHMNCMSMYGGFPTVVDTCVSAYDLSLLS